MHALIVFGIFVVAVTFLVFSIKKNRKERDKINELLKDDVSTEGLNKLELAASAKKFTKRIWTRIIILVILIVLFYIFI